jgi:hypothetical protein
MRKGTMHGHPSFNDIQETQVTKVVNADSLPRPQPR